MNCKASGSSLVANRLRIVDTICESVTVVIANKQAIQDPWKRAKIDALCLMLRGALAAKEKVVLKLNVAQVNLDKVVELLPSLHSPTVNQLAERDWVAVETIVDESTVRTLIPQLKTLVTHGKRRGKHQAKARFKASNLSVFGKLSRLSI